MSLPGGSATAAASMTVQVAQTSLEKDFDLLYLILDMMSSIDNAKDQKEELTRKVVAFKMKMTQCKDLLSKVPGLDCSPDEQDRIHEICKEDLQKKQDAITKFKSLDIITSAVVKEESMETT